MATTVTGYPCKIRRLTADEGGGYLVTFPDLPGCMSDGETVAEARGNAADAVAGYLDSCRKRGDPAPVQGSGGLTSGKFLVRLPKSLHVQLVERARTEGVSMNLMVTSLVAEGLGRHAVSRHHPVRHSRSKQKT